jgi:hypothetical protein
VAPTGGNQAATRERGESVRASAVDEWAPPHSERKREWAGRTRAVEQAAAMGRELGLRARMGEGKGECGSGLPLA